MQFTALGRTGLCISELTIGNTVAITTGKVFDEAAEKDCVAAIHAMVDQGANYIDTAASYAGGRSEIVVGKALKELDRSKIIINSKFGIVVDDSKPHHVLDSYQDNSYKNCIQECENSLRRLGTDYIDTYMPHHFDHTTNVEETMRALLTLQKQGKIRYIGLSNHTVEQVQACQKYARIDVIEVPYAMVDRQAESLMQWAHENDIATMVFGVLGNGILTGRYRTLPQLAFYDCRFAYNYFQEPQFSQVMSVLRVMDEIAAERNVPVSEIAINWVRNHSFVSSVILGTGNPKNAIRNCQALRWQLSAEEMRRLDAAIETYVGMGVNHAFLKEKET